jgi:AcrR family transcriptional regulator
MNTSFNKVHAGRERSCEKALNRRERRCAETRERIIRAALSLFSERGVVGTTIEDITNAADVGKGTFFNYFPSKEHVLAHLCQLQMGKIREFVGEAMNSTEPVDRVLYKLALIVTEEFAHSPELVRSILAPFFSSESARGQMADDLEEDREVLAELISARQKRLEIRADFTPIELALQVQRALFGTTILWSLDPSKSLADCLKEMTAVLWSGIRNQTADRECSSIGGHLS